MAASNPMLSSSNDDWCSPSVLLDVVREVAPIGLDPCSNANSIVNATVNWNKDENGFIREWSGHGLVYVNSPYGRQLPNWVDKVCAEVNTARFRAAGELIMLTPSRTDTFWFAKARGRCDALCFWHGRLTFSGAPHVATFPSAVFYFGARRYRFAEAFDRKGWVVFP